MAEGPTSPARFVLDASAIIAYFNDEDGADKVEQLIEQAQSGEAELYAASINLYEVFYDTLRRGSSEKAEEVLADLYALPMTVIETLDRALMRHAGRFKTTYRLSVADSFALGLAKMLGAQVVSTDHHEFDPVEKSGDVRFVWLR